ncbi:hypothetical protein J7438_01175 [Thalassotalea sp. G20_0]|uniref:hypothetical protein n=1 Tax=Thalassotalea sp. G20_0 TaxID=2821093 RepID=UPI001ADBD086|nr:hypothetical protein [Thalassotalea sp. G20_0]MBO9492703.1 hypothetical protein [Thalassotalea sp. G20_0]
MKSRGDWSVNGTSGGVVYPQATQAYGAIETVSGSPDRPANLTARATAFGRRCCVSGCVNSRLSSTVAIVGGYLLLVGGGVGGALLYSRSIGLGLDDLETETNVVYGGLAGLVVYAAGVCCLGACKRVMGTRDVEAAQGRENLPADAD